MLSTLLLALFAGTSAGCFNGGALVGAQAGFVHAILKQEAKANPIKKEDADKQVKLFADALGDEAAYRVLQADDAGKKNFKDQKEFDDKTAFIKLDLTDSKSDADAVKAAVAKLTELSNKLTATDNFKKAEKVEVIVLVKDAAAAAVFTEAELAKAGKEFAKDEDARKAIAKKLVDADAEMKYTSNNGFAGLHAGYLGRVNDKFLVGGLVEGNWVFGQDMKVDGNAVKDTSARFNVNVFLRAMFNLTDKFMAGADIGFSGQEIRQLKSTVATAATTTSKDKESKWFWNPAARLVLGVALTENILATAHFGGVFPMMKQDSLDKTVKAKYSNLHGGVGISYAFGG